MTPSSQTCLGAVDVLVLAGGLGTRIRPVLGDVPKLLAPVRGQTYLDHLLSWLGAFGARRVVLGLGHRAQAVIDYLHTNPLSGLAVETVIEPEPLGTAGAIRYARAKLRTDPTLVLNGDSIADADLCAFLRHHRQSNALATLLCAEVEDASRFGRVLLDNRGMIEGFAEKSAALDGPAVVNAGVYLMSAALLDDIAAGAGKSLERDVFECLPKASLAAFTACRDFVDIGTPESLAFVNRNNG